LALDEPKDTDETFDVDGFAFVIDKELNEQGAPFKIDLTYMGFAIDSKLELGGGDGCSSCSSCG
jgi:hypothetical protein